MEDKTLTRCTDEEGRADEVEKVKNEQIQKQKDGKGHWHEEIASDSESIVCLKAKGPGGEPFMLTFALQIKADRGDIEASKSTIDKLQKETAKVAGEKHGK